VGSLLLLLTGQESILIKCFDLECRQVILLLGQQFLIFLCNYLNKHFTSIANKVRTFPSTNCKSETLGSFVKNKVDLPDFGKFDKML
jgi:hypothetical protein